MYDANRLLTRGRITVAARSAWSELQRRCRSRRCITALVLVGLQVVLSGEATAAIETKERSEPTVEVPAGGASVPTLDIGGRPMVEININGRGPFPFILDTGATQSVIDTGLSTELALPSAGEGSRLDEVVIGSIKVAGLTVMIGPVSAMFGKIEKPPRGVLSALSFPGYLVTFDYPRKQVSLRKGALPESNGTTIVGYEADEMLPTVPVKVAGRQIKVHLDTGAPFALSLPTEYKDEVPLIAPAEEKGKARSHSGEFPVFEGTLQGEITIGEYKLPTREVLFTDVVPHPGATPRAKSATRHCGTSRSRLTQRTAGLSSS